MSKKRWWCLKMNGELILILPSQEPLTIDDFEHHDVPIDLNRTAKVVELDVRQKAKAEKNQKIGALISKWEKQIKDIQVELERVVAGDAFFSISNIEAHEQAVRTLRQCIKDVRKTQKTESGEALKEAYDKGFFAGQQKGWTEGVEYGKIPF